MANNTEQDTRQAIGFWLSKLQERTVRNHPPLIILDKDEEELEKAINGIYRVLEAEATRREQAARIDELTSLRAITLSNSVVDDNGDPIHPPTSLDEAVLNRIDELKRQAKGGK